MVQKIKGINDTESDVLYMLKEVLHFGDPIEIKQSIIINRLRTILGLSDLAAVHDMRLALKDMLSIFDKDLSEGTIGFSACSAGHLALSKTVNSPYIKYKGEYIHTITQDDIDGKTRWGFILLPVMGRLMPFDLGKQVYRSHNGVYQVENDEQLKTRTGK